MATNTNPNPTGLTPAYSNTGFVRYQRALKANGQWVTCYRTAAAGTGKANQATLAYLATLLGTTPANLPTFVAYNHTTMACAGFAAWAPCYAYTNAMAHAALAPSVVASLGKQGLAAVPVPCTLRAAPSATGGTTTPA